MMWWWYVKGEVRGVAEIDRNDRRVIFPLSPSIATNDADEEEEDEEYVDDDDNNMKIYENGPIH